MKKSSKKQDFIGIAEIEMKLVKKENSENVNYNLHSLFSVVDNYLIAQCLDVSMTTRIDIKDFISDSKLKSIKSDELAKKIMREIFILHIKDISGHIFACDNDNIAYPFTHASEKYWKEFRNIRMVRDNYSFNLFHEKSTSGIEAFIDFEEQIKNILNNITPQINGSYKKSFIPYLNDLRETA